MNYDDFKLFTRSDTVLSEQDLLQFEQEHQLKLPTDYRNSLLKYNGGLFFDDSRYAECLFYTSVLLEDDPEPTEVEDQIISFCSLEELYPGIYRDLDLELYDDDEEEQTVRAKAKTLLEIADGISGNYLIDFGPEKYGQIFFYLNENIDIEKQPYLVAPSFRAWVEQFVFEERFDFTLGKKK